jgi:hypothetical protein
MSYDLHLLHPTTKEKIILSENHTLRGGTFVLGGTNRAWLNVTYNYAIHFYRVFGEKGIRTLYGCTGEESIPLIDAAMAQLGDDQTDNYWDATEGNAKKALADLKELAQLCPYGIWDGD